MSTRSIAVEGQAITSGGRSIPLGPLGETEITNYLEDDWGDNALTSRSSTNDGVFAHPDANEAGDVLIGRYRPEWNTVTAGFSVSGGVINWDGSSDDDATIRTNSNFVIGSWEIDVHFTTLGNGDDSVKLSFINTTPNGGGSVNPDDGYQQMQLDDGSHLLRRYDGGASTNIISSSWGGGSGDTDNHTYKTTRDAYGDWEIFEDASSDGTATDTNYKKTAEVSLACFESGGGSVVDIDNLVVK